VTEPIRYRLEVRLGTDRDVSDTVRREILREALAAFRQRELGDE